MTEPHACSKQSWSWMNQKVVRRRMPSMMVVHIDTWPQQKIKRNTYRFFPCVLFLFFGRFFGCCCRLPLCRRTIESLKTASFLSWHNWVRVLKKSTGQLERKWAKSEFGRYFLASLLFAYFCCSFKMCEANGTMKKKNEWNHITVHTLVLSTVLHTLANILTMAPASITTPPSRSLV